MIHPAEGARAFCDETGCSVSHEVRLCLLLGGGLVFEPKDAPGWQICVTSTGVLKSFCPAHHLKVSSAGVKILSATPSPVIGERH